MITTHNWFSARVRRHIYLHLRYVRLLRSPLVSFFPRVLYKPPPWFCIGIRSEILYLYVGNSPHLFYRKLCIMCESLPS